MKALKDQLEESTAQATCYYLINSGSVNTLEDARKKELKLYLHSVKPEMSIWQLEKCARIIYAVETHLGKEVCCFSKRVIN